MIRFGASHGRAGSRARREPVADTLSRLSEALARTMTARDGLTQQHSQRVQRWALALAHETGITDSAILEAIGGAALLHDIGKLGIPDLVLQKPGPLTRDEYDRVKAHVTIGADILTAAAFPSSLALIVRHHHENWDGTGYPDRLRGEDIPIGARVIAVVDCYDALTSDRPYRRALSHGSAVAMIHERRGTMYDVNLADAFLGIVQHLRDGAAREGADRPRTRANPSWLEATAV
ncbi:MAG: HD domain-containing protein [Acidobacteriia bacterium]|nr:HD domain-containing protein [Terriglobia bacterium]